MKNSFKNDLSILISSCDKNVFLLHNFTKLFNKYWEAFNDYDKFIITATVDVSIPNYTSILTNTQEWTDSLIIALDQIKTPYVYFLLDDFYYFRKFPSNKLENALSLCKAFNLDKYIFHYPHVCFQGNNIHQTFFGNNIYQVDRFAEYTMTTQASIWDVSFLKKCLKVGETPWQFELEGTVRVNNEINHNIYIEIEERYYVEALSRGSFTPEYYQLMQIENLKQYDIRFT